jgi:CTD kinase subunit beta
MLEASGFDFRVRYPQKHIIKLAKDARIDKDVAKVAFEAIVDLYKTFAPLKQTCATMSFACIEFATLILEKQQENIRGQGSPSYKKWCTTRAEIMETLLDLLDLYTHFQKSSIVGPSYNIEKFIQLKIKLNQEVEEDATLSRYTEQHEPPKTNGIKSNIKTPKTPITPASPSDARINGKDIASPATLSPRSSGSGRKSIGARGQDGTIRFMLNADQAKKEKETVAEYFKVELEEYEIEVEEPIKNDRPQHHHNDHNHHGHRNGRDNRFHHHNKRMRR